MQEEAHGLARLGVGRLVVVQNSESNVESVEEDKIDQQDEKEAVVSVLVFCLAVLSASKRENAVSRGLAAF